MVGAVAVRMSCALRFVSSIPVREKYYYGVNIVVLGLAVWVCVFKRLK